MDRISFTRETFEFWEKGQSKFPVTLVRSGNGIGAVSAQIKLASGTKTGRATLGKDYKHPTINVTWADGEIGEKIIDIGIIDDGIAEPIERVNLSFGTITGAIVGAIANCVVAIQDSTSATDPINPEPNKIINVCSQSDYVKRIHQDGLCFNLEFTKPGLKLEQMHFDYDLGVTLWKCEIPLNFGDVHSVSIAFSQGELGANPGLELVGLAFSYDNVTEFYKALEIKGFIPKLKPENNNLYAAPGYVESIQLYPFAEIAIDGTDVTRRYVVDETLDEHIELSNLKNFHGQSKFNAVSIQQGQEFVLILEQTLKTNDRPLYLYVSEGGVAGETFSVYLNPVPFNFTFPSIKPGTNPKYFGL